jgi:hypothetical protein
MSDNLCQDGLGFVPEGIVGCLISVGRELKWLLELPLKVQRQAHWDLIACESGWLSVTCVIIKRATRVHILRRHFELIFAEGVQPTECDVWMGDTVLSGRKQLELIPGLQNRTVVCWDVQTEHDSVIERHQCQLFQGTRRSERTYNNATT